MSRYVGDSAQKNRISKAAKTTKHGDISEDWSFQIIGKFSLINQHYTNIWGNFGKKPISSAIISQHIGNFLLIILLYQQIKQVLLPHFPFQNSNTSPFAWNRSIRSLNTSIILPPFSISKFKENYIVKLPIFQHVVIRFKHLTSHQMGLKYHISNQLSLKFKLKRFELTMYIMHSNTPSRVISIFWAYT